MHDSSAAAAVSTISKDGKGILCQSALRARQIYATRGNYGFNTGHSSPICIVTTTKVAILVQSLYTPTFFKNANQRLAETIKKEGDFSKYSQRRCDIHFTCNVWEDYVV